MGVAVAREHLVARVRKANFTYDRRGDRTELYRQRGTAQRVAIPRRDWIPEKNARTILTQAGLSEKEIEEFLRHAETTCSN